jgi:DnaJ-class molecular chaperone
MRKRPKRPYRNFHEFLDNIKFAGWSVAERILIVKRGINYPCERCGGEGAFYAISRGSNGWNQGKCTACPDCEGTGKGTKKACQASYRQSIDRWKKEADEYDALVAAKKEALKKLTKEEVKVLQELGV